MVDAHAVALRTAALRLLARDQLCFELRVERVFDGEDVLGVLNRNGALCARAAQEGDCGGEMLIGDKDRGFACREGVRVQSNDAGG